MEVAVDFPGRVVLGADTIVVLNQVVFGKPANLDEALSILLRLSGKSHEVITSVCLRVISHPAPDSLPVPELQEFSEISRVRFRNFGKADVLEYFRTVNPLDKAGAYAAQEDAGRLIEEIGGCADNVAGLPVSRVIQALKGNFSDIVDLPGGC